MKPAVVDPIGREVDNSREVFSRSRGSHAGQGSPQGVDGARLQEIRHQQLLFRVPGRHQFAPGLIVGREEGNSFGEEALGDSHVRQESVEHVE